MLIGTARERIVLVGLLALLVLIATPLLMKRLNRVVDNKTDMDLQVLQGAALEWMAETGRAVPESLEPLFAGEAGGSNARLLDELRDVWGRRYRYARMSGGTGFMVFQLGADGVPGGVGDDADQVRLFDLAAAHGALIGLRGERKDDLRNAARVPLGCEPAPDQNGGGWLLGRDSNNQSFHDVALGCYAWYIISYGPVRQGHGGCEPREGDSFRAG